MNYKRKLKEVRQEQLDLWESGKKYSLEYYELIEKEKELLTILNIKITKKILVYLSNPGDEYYERKLSEEKEYRIRIEERRAKSPYELEMKLEERELILKHNANPDKHILKTSDCDSRS